MKVGIIGFGLMGRRRLKALLECGDECVGYYDPIEWDGLGEDAPFRAAMPQILTAEAVIVATPHDALAEAAITCLRGGCHVLLEKPCGISLDEVKRVKNAAREAGLECVPGFTLRHYPGLRELRRVLVQEKRYGAVLYLRAVYGHGGKVADWHLDPKRGGGVLLDQGAHLADLAGWFTARGGVRGAFRVQGGSLDGVPRMVTFSYGMALLQASWAEWRPTFRVEVLCENGGGTVEGLGGPYGDHKLTLFERWCVDSVTDYGDAREVALRSEWQAFKSKAFDAPLGEHVDLMDDAVAAMRIAEEVRGASF